MANKKDSIVKPATRGSSKKITVASKKTGINMWDSNTQDEQHLSFPWLSNYEATQLGRGGYYDTEGCLHNVDGCVRCTSMVAATGKRCKNFAVPGEITCHIHGGTLARAKTGKMRLYSAFIADPTLANIYENSCNGEDKAVMGIREELALLRTLLAKVLRDTGVNEMKEVKEAAGVIGEIRQLVESCTKAEVRLGQLVDIGKITIIMGQAAKIIMKYVKDPEVIEHIAREFDNILIPSAIATTPQFEPINRSNKVRELPTEIL